MKHIKKYKIFESNSVTLSDEVKECFLPVIDMLYDGVKISTFSKFNSVKVDIEFGDISDQNDLIEEILIKIYDLNSEICEEVANAVSHCIGMGLYFIGAIVYYHNRINRVKSFTSNDIEEFYNFMTARNLKYQLKIEFKKD